MPNYSETSTGERLTESQIRSRYTKALKEHHAGLFTNPVCSGCGKNKAQHNDHTISQKRCKQIGKAELIYAIGENTEDSCNKCHMEWESFKDGAYLDHLNVVKRMAYMKKHDPEGYELRMNLTNTE